MKQVGARTKYRADFPERAEALAKKKLLDSGIAKSLGISLSTYYLYQEKHPEFMEAIKRGKAPVDQDVEDAFIRRALGYDVEEVTTEQEFVGGLGEAGDLDAKNRRMVQVKIRKTKKHIAPDVVAGIFFLKNRRPDKWRDKREAEITLTPKMSLDELIKSTEALGDDDDNK